MLRCLRWTVVPALIALSACGGGGSGSSPALGTGSSSGVSASSSSGVTSSSSGVTSSSSGASSSSGGAHVFSLSSPNVAAVTVGPGTSDFFDIPTTSVTVCIAGTSTCTTVGNVLVDTGSVGLRLMASALNGLALAMQHDPSVPANTIAECLPFADGFTWGPVATADVVIGGEKASAVPINIIDDTGTYAPTIPTSCTDDGAPLSSVSDLGSNGVLGVGLFTQDCGPYCAQAANVQTAPFFYYSCTSSTCAPASEPVNDQVINPVALFATDNNGVILQLPAIPDAGQTSATGFLVFGIGTEANNGLGSATVLTADPNQGTITTLYNSQTLTGSFLDSGSNGLFFPDTSIPDCPGNAMQMQFYCPTSTLSLTATNQGLNGNTSIVPFKIANLKDISNADFAIDDVGGTATTIMGLGTSYFDFGLPFFYDRTVFTAIDGMQAGGTAGPYFAY
jgi:hypothetical protein